MKATGRILALLPLVAVVITGLGQDPPATPGRGSFFAITTPDAEASVAWYGEHLGFELVSEQDLTGRGIKMRNMKREGAWLELIERPDALDRRKEGVPIGFFKAGFFVDDIAALHDSASAAGLDVDRLIGEGGQRFFTLRDLDGNRLQVFERGAD